MTKKSKINIPPLFIKHQDRDLNWKSVGLHSSYVTCNASKGSGVLKHLKRPREMLYIKIEFTKFAPYYITYWNCKLSRDIAFERIKKATPKSKVLFSQEEFFQFQGLNREQLQKRLRKYNLPMAISIESNTEFQKGISQAELFAKRWNMSVYTSIKMDATDVATLMNGVLPSHFNEYQFIKELTSTLPKPSNIKVSAGLYWEVLVKKLIK